MRDVEPNEVGHDVAQAGEEADGQALRELVAQLPGHGDAVVAELVLLVRDVHFPGQLERGPRAEQQRDPEHAPPGEAQRGHISRFRKISSLSASSTTV
jgi:hypothetical protein